MSTVPKHFQLTTNNELLAQTIHPFTTMNNKQLKSKSQEEFTSRYSVNCENKNCNKSIHDFVTAATESKSKIIIKCLANKIRKLCLKLQIPGEEKKAKKKIQSILSQLSGNIYSADENNREVTQSCTNIILPLERNFVAKKIETPKYYSRYKIIRLKEILKAWVENLTINEDSLAAITKKKTDIFNYIYEKLEHAVLVRPRSVSRYASLLKSNIKDIINDLTVHFEVPNKDINSLSLLNDIISVDNDIPMTYIQSTSNEISDMVKNDLAYFLSNEDSTINNKTRNILQTKLTEYLLDITNIDDEDENITNDIICLIKDISKITEDKAQFLAHIIINDYKAFFFRRYEFSRQEKCKIPQCDYLKIDGNESKDLQSCKEMLSKDIASWLSRINMSTLDKQAKEFAIDSLVSDIINKYKYFQNKLYVKENDTENRWSKNILDKKHNTKTIEHDNYLPEAIKNVSEPLFVASQESCLQNLKEEIYSWYYNLPNDIHSLEIHASIRQLINELVENIKNSGISNDLQTVDQIINDWVTNTFSRQLRNEYVAKLNKIIKSTPLYTAAKAQICLENEDKSAETKIDEESNKALDIETYSKCSNVLNNSSRCHDDLDDLTEKSVEAWLNKLPLRVTDFDCFNNKKATFIANMKYLKKSGSDDNTIVREIIKFMKTLPMETNGILDDTYFDGKAYNFLQCLSNRSIDKKRTANKYDIIEAVGDVIENWAQNLPLEPMYNIKYFRLLMNELTSVIISTINHSNLKLNDKNNNDQLKDIIISFLLKLPLGLEQLSTLQLATATENLVEALKDIYLNADYYIEPTNKCKETSFSIYDFTLENTRDCSYSNYDYTSANVVDNNQEHPSTNDRTHKNVDIPMNGAEPSHVTSKKINSVTRSTNTMCSGNKTLSSNAKEIIFDKYTNILKQKIAELPIDTPTPESAQLAELAKTAIFNGILKTFFKLKADPEIQNDYGYFELILEDKLDDMLDLLPQTDQIKALRHCWKLDILSQVLNMLKELQDVTDRPSLKQRLKNGFNRRFANRHELEQCFVLQQGFLAEMADAYILHSKYKEEDSIRAKIYKQRLMNKVEDLVNHLIREHNTQFRMIKKSTLVDNAMKAMESVAIPRDDILNDEIEELHLVEEIEKWYKELPISPYMNDFDVVFRKRMIGLLAKKLHEIEKNCDEFSLTKEEQMKHEMSKFLAERGRLEPNQDLNINNMVDVLSNRLKNRQLNVTTEYDIFEQRRPISSTLANFDHGNILTPFENIDESSYQNSLQRRNKDTSQYSQLDSLAHNKEVNHGLPFQRHVQRDHTLTEVQPIRHPIGPRLMVSRTGSPSRLVSPKNFVSSKLTRKAQYMVDPVNSERYTSNVPFSERNRIQLRPSSSSNSDQQIEGITPFHSQRPSHSQNPGLYDTSEHRMPQIPWIHNSMTCSRSKSPRQRINGIENSECRSYYPTSNNNELRDNHRNGNECKEIEQEYDQDMSQARLIRPVVRFSTNSQQKVSSHFGERVTARIDSNEGRDSNKDKTDAKCWCVERSRKKRRICVDSYPCPSSGLPCLCHY